MHEVVPAAELSVFSAQQLAFLMCGVRELDVVRQSVPFVRLVITCKLDWKKHTIYEGYQSASSVVLWFWEIVEAMSPSQRVCWWPCSRFHSLDHAVTPASVLHGIDPGAH
jgi:hypothetical protein